MEELDLVDLFYMIKRRLWLIILLFVLCAGTAYAVSEYTIVPQYYTRAQLMLGKPSPDSTEAIDSSEISFNRKIIKTYATIAKTDSVMVDVAKALASLDNPINVSADGLKSAISLGLINDTEVISVSMVGTNPEMITEIVNTFSDVFSVRIAEIMNIDNVRILEKAKVPRGPMPSSLKRNVVFGGGVGIAVALFIIFLIEMFDHTMKIPEDVTKHLNLPVLGLIPEHD